MCEGLWIHKYLYKWLTNHFNKHTINHRDSSVVLQDVQTCMFTKRAIFIGCVQPEGARLHTVSAWEEDGWWMWLSLIGPAAAVSQRLVIKIIIRNSLRWPERLIAVFWGNEPHCSLWTPNQLLLVWSPSHFDLQTVLQELDVTGGGSPHQSVRSQ